MVECSGRLVPMRLACLAPLVGVNTCEDEKNEVQDPIGQIRVSHGLAANTQSRRVAYSGLPDEARKDDAAKFESTSLFDNMPQKWTIIFFDVAVPELEQTQTG